MCDGAELMKAARRNAGGVGISQAPQRLKRSAGIGPASNAAAAHQVRSQSDAVAPRLAPNNAEPPRRLSQAPKRPVAKPQSAAIQSGSSLPSLPEDTIALPGMDCTTILKPARRGTIYIPSEDTTMPSMYMGIFSPIKDFDTTKCTSTPAAGVHEPGS